MSNTIYVRLYEERDYSQYENLYQSVYKKSRWNNDRFNNGHYKNPSSLGTPLIFVACDSTGKIVGANSFFPDKMTFQNEEYLVAQSGDTMTLEEYRGRGIFSLLLKEAERTLFENGYKLIFGFPNNNSYPGMRKAGFSTLQEIPSYLKIINFHKFLSLRYKGNVLAQMIGKSADALLHSFQYFRGKLDCTDYLLTNFDDNIADFFKPIHGKAHIVKSQEYFEWKYYNRTCTNYRVVSIQRNGSPVSKFLIKEEETAEGFKYGAIIDYVIIQPKWLIRSVHSLCLACNKIGYYSLLAFGLNEQEMIYGWKKMAFFRKARLYLLVKPLCEKVEWPSNVDDWRFVLADADVTF